MFEISTFEVAYFTAGSVSGVLLTVFCFWLGHRDHSDSEMDRLRRAERVISEQIDKLSSDRIGCHLDSEPVLLAAISEFYEQLVEVRRQIVRHKTGGKPVVTAEDRDL
jgi:hypothetical protein